MLLWLLWKHLLRYVQKCVFQMVPNQVNIKYQVSNKYHRWALGSLLETSFGEEVQSRVLLENHAWGKGALFDPAR